MLLVYSYYLVDFYNALQWTLSTMTSKNKNGGDSWGTLYGRPMERLAIRYDRHEEMGDIHYSCIRDTFALSQCAVGFALRNIHEIYFLQMALGAFNVFVVC